MKWLLTYCDGGSGYKTSQLLTQEGAVRLLVHQGHSKIDAQWALDPCGGKRQDAVVLSDGEAVLYPVPEDASEYPDVEAEFCENEEECDSHDDEDAEENTPND